jgi:hypothetical protein
MYTASSRMMSNVPGPQSEAHFGGQPIDELSFLSLGVIGTYCGICTYNGHVGTCVYYMVRFAADLQSLCFVLSCCANVDIIRCT